MTGLLYALGRTCARHRFAVLTAWTIALVGIALVAHSVGEQTSDNLVLPGTDSQQATDTLTQKFPAQANGTNPITLQAAAGKKLTDSTYKSAIDDVVRAYG